MILDSADHPEDGALLRLIDGEADPIEEAAALDHLRICAECRKRRVRFERLSDRFTELLAELGEPRAEKRPPRLTLRRGRTALVVIAVAAVLVVSPVRAWVLDAWAALKGLVASTPPVLPTATSVVSFATVSEVFAVQVIGQPRRGTLTLLSTDSPRVTVTVLGGDGRDELTVLESGLRIRTAPLGVASYEVRIPRRTRFVSVETPHATWTKIDMTELQDGRWSVLLARAPP